MTLRYVDLAGFKATPLTREPFQFLSLPGFLNAEACVEINRDYPKIAESGSFPVAQVSFGPAFQQLLDEMGSDEFRHAFEEKFDVDLTGRPYTITVRGRCIPRDGRIHTDTKSKIITILIYMNPEWDIPGDGLGLLKSNAGLDDPIMEVPPAAGNLLAFERSEKFLAAATCPSRANAGSSSSTGSPRKATAASPCCAIISRRPSSACSARPRNSPTRDQAVA